MQVEDRGGVGLRAARADASRRSSTTAAARPASRHCSRPSAPACRRSSPTSTATKAKTLGVPLTDVFTTLQAYLGSAYVNDFNKFGRTYQVRVQAEPAFRTDAEDIRRLEVRNRDGADGAARRRSSTVETRVGPQIVTRYNLYPSASITGEAGARRQLGRGARR